MSYAEAFGPFSLIGGGCRNWSAAQVSITVPGAGRVVVSGSMILTMNHNTTSSDSIALYVEPTPSGCSQVNALWLLPQTAANGTYTETLPLARKFDIAAAGTHTFYIQYQVFAGLGPGDVLNIAHLAAVFYPN